MRYLKCFFVVLALILLYSSYSHAASILIECTEPGASVSVDSKDYGKTDDEGNAYVADITAGTHKLTVSKDGYETWSEDIDVKDRLTKVVKVTLKKAEKKPLETTAQSTGSVLIQSSAPGAAISIDTMARGKTDDKGMAFITDIPSGIHKVTISKNGYETWSADVTIKAKLTEVVEVILALSDTNPPELKIISPASSRGIKAVVRGDVIDIIGLARDESKIVNVTINGKAATISQPDDNELKQLPGNTVKFTGQIALAAGDNTLIIEALDESNNRAVLEHIIDRKEDALTALNMGFYALIIGVNDYRHWYQLSNPVHDAATLAQELEDNYGFTTKLLLNPTKSEVLSNIRSYYNRKFSENSELLIVLSGHGHFDDFSKTGYFVAADGRKADDDPNFETYIAYPNLQNIITNIKCKHILLVLDACFGGTFNIQIAMRGGEQDTYRNLTKEEFILRKLKFQTRMLVTSGGKEYVPDGRPGSHSPFMRKFLQGLRDYGGKDGVLTVEELMENYMNYVEPEPYLMEFQYGNEPGSSFLFIAR